MERLAQVIIPSTNKLMYVQAKDQTNEPKDRLSCVCVPLTPLLNGLFNIEFRNLLSYNLYFVYTPMGYIK